MLQIPNLSLKIPHSVTLQVNQEQFELLAQANCDLKLERTAEN